METLSIIKAVELENRIKKQPSYDLYKLQLYGLKKHYHMNTINESQYLSLVNNMLTILGDSQ